MGQTSGQCSITNGIPAGHFAGPLTPIQGMSRELSIRCQWMSGDGLTCGQMVTGGTVSAHLAEHGIQNMHRDRIVRCCWSECYILIKRQGIARHYREVHLGVKRKSYKHASPTFTADVF
ncbi:hypothetical protein J3R83DRAFT_2448 [Lanmaoa asiatica]|nr:hypothetical protein J3R83DRAFT_2448 [Lanmaoa asiatica]